MKRKRSPFIRHLQTLAVASATLATLPAQAGAPDISFTANLQDRINRIESAIQAAARGPETQVADPIIPFNNFVFIRIVTPYNKFVRPTPPDPNSSSFRASAVEIFEAVRRG